MYVSEAKIRNYRSLKDFRLELAKNLSLVIGKNNTGKTSFITLFDKFTGNTNDKNNSFVFNDFSTDFQTQLKESVENPILSEDYIEQSLSLELSIECSEDDNLANFSELEAILDLDDRIHTIHILFKYFLDYESYSNLCQDYQGFKAALIEKNVDINDERYNLLNYLKKEFKNYFKIKVYSVEYDNPDNMIEINKNAIDKLIQVKIIKATRYVSNDRGTQTLSKLSCDYFNSSDDVDTIRRDLSIKLMSADKELDSVYEDVFDSVKDTFDTFTNGSTDLSVKSMLKENNLLENNTQVLYNQEGGVLPEEFNGLGYMNFFAILFDLHIKLRDFLKNCEKNDGKSIINLLFIEEPEAHTHPQMQYVFIKNIKSMLKEWQNKGISNLQTIITTHSSYIVSQSDFDDIRYFLKSDNRIQAKNINSLRMNMLKNAFKRIKSSNTELTHQQIKDLTRAEDKKRFDFIKQYLTLSSAELFFADKVIFIEGTTERILLPEMIRKVDLENRVNNAGYVSLASQHISIMEVSTYSHLFKELIDFLEVKALIITDIDSIDSGNDRKKVPVELGDLTSNQSIKILIGTDVLENLLAKTAADKVQNNNIMVAYQTSDNGYNARSFEDAFICSNYDYIRDKVGIFNSLTSISKINENPNYYEIARDCITGKSSFACDLLYYDKDWVIPPYIKEGLTWLAI